LGLKDWLGRFWKRFGSREEPGRFRVIYKYVVNPFLIHFSQDFSLFPLFSLFSHYLLQYNSDGSGVVGSKSDAAVSRHGRRRRRCYVQNNPFFLNFFRFLAPLLLLYTFLKSKFPITQPKLLDLKRDKTREKRYYLLLSFGFVVISRWWLCRDCFGLNVACGFVL
jgi:hypothetical protein